MGKKLSSEKGVFRKRRVGGCNSIKNQSLLGGSWVVISGVVNPLIWVISIATLLITLLITTHEPPSRGCVCVVETCRDQTTVELSMFIRLGYLQA